MIFFYDGRNNDIEWRKHDCYSKDLQKETTTRKTNKQTKPQVNRLEE